MRYEILNNKQMKIIFLDIDGVLNSQELAWENKKKGLSGYGGWFTEGDVCTHENVLWGKDQFKNLRKIVEETGAKIVMSSTWRIHFSIGKFKEMFKLYGWENPPIIDATPSMAGVRGNEIAEWMKGKEIASYVILDDGTDFHDEQMPFFVNTDFMVGLSEGDAEKAITVLRTICT